MGTHDSYAIGEGIFDNQDQNVTTQLDNGVRMLQSQAHNQNGTLELCHTDCSLQDGGSLQNYLQTVKSWMDANPNEVVTLLIVNIDDQAPSVFDTVFKAAGADSISFVPSSPSMPAANWPTLGSMIDSGKRLVTFLDTQANNSNIPYILDEFSNIWETAFDVTGAFDCAVNRSDGGDTSSQMYLINHFLDEIVLGNDAPDEGAANVTNSASSDPSSLQSQVTTCQGQYNKPPTFMLLDFYEFAGQDPFKIAAQLNGVQFNSSTPIASPVSTASGSSSSSGSGKNSASRSFDGQLHTITYLTIVASILFGASIVL